MKMKTFCLIIGTQKGGTTSLFQYLSQHPQVAPSRIKETNFFANSRQWQKGLDYYHGLWAWEPAKHRIALEASPSYTRSELIAKRVIARAQTLDAHIKCIYLVRDPVRQIESMRKQGVYQGWYRERLRQETPQTLPEKALDQVHYATIAAQFVTAFFPENVLLLKTEDLSASATKAMVMQTICQFLAIDPSFQFALGKVHNAQHSYRNDTIWHFLREFKPLGRFKSLVPDSLKNKARAVLSRPLSQNQNPVPPLTLAQKRFIIATLQHEFNQLETAYALDLSNWTREC